MSYPQPSADVAVTNQLTFFRLNTKLISPGDIYESPQGALAFAIGPDSDISKVVAVYYDPTFTPTPMNSMRIGPNRSFTSLIAARNEVPYTPVINPTDKQNQRPGKILIYTDDLYDPSWRPQNASANDTVTFIDPLLDVVLFFQNPGSVPSDRVDKTFYFPSLSIQLAPPDDTYIVVPYYGRKYAHVSAISEPGTPTTFGVLGINYQPGDSLAGGAIAMETELLADAVISEVDATNLIVTAGNQGMFDALVLHVAGATDGSPSVRIVMSDTPASTP